MSQEAERHVVENEAYVYQKLMIVGGKEERKASEDCRERSSKNLKTSLGRVSSEAAMSREDRLVGSPKID